MRLQTGGRVPSSVTLIANTSIEQASRAEFLSFLYVDLGHEVGIRTNRIQFIFAHTPQILLSKTSFMEQSSEYESER
ncbi:MAG: hypothetical protein WCC25_00345 [Candidatus Korobacteraceae bacterium]